MAILVKFNVSNMTAEKYETVLKRLEAAGAGAPFSFSQTPVNHLPGFRIPRERTEESTYMLREIVVSTLAAIDRWLDTEYQMGSGELYLSYRTREA